MCRGMRLLRYICAICLMLALPPVLHGFGLSVPEVDHAVQEESVDVGALLFGHIGDSYGWHITDWNGKHISIPLPCIVKSSDGWHCFMSSEIAHGHEYNGLFVAEEGRYKDKIVERGADGELIRPFDISITKNVCSLIFTGLLLILLVLGAARWYKKNDASEKAPGGFAGLVELMVMMVNDELIKPSIRSVSVDGILFHIHQQPAGYCAVFSGRSKCDGKYRSDYGSGFMHLCRCEPVWKQALLEGNSLAGCSGLSEVSASDNADDRAFRIDCEAFFADGPTVC